MRFSGRYILLLLAAWLGVQAEPHDVYAQSDGILQIGDPIHRFLMRQYSAGFLRDAHLSHRPISAYEARIYLDELAASDSLLHPLDRRLLKQYREEEPHPVAASINKRVPWLYQNGRDFLSIAEDDYAFQINPLVHAGWGQGQRALRNEKAQSRVAWENSRGLRASGHIGKHIFFESRFMENVASLPLVDFGRKTIPRQGYTKFNVGAQDDKLPVESFSAMGMVGYRDKHFEVRYGRDQNLWGFSRTSVQLSNYAPLYNQLQIRANVWRFQYVSLFASMIDLSDFPPKGFVPPDQIYPRKFGAFHRLSIDLPARMQISLFEGVMYAPDSTGRRLSFDPNYVNPMAFLTAVEQDVGSGDNAFIGITYSVGLLPYLRLYTELMLDEFRILEFRNPGGGWWGNKWSWMYGLHWIDPYPGINSSIRIDYTRVRPFTGAHDNPRNSYQHYNDFLGHPAGPNTENLSFFIQAQPHDRVFAELNLAITVRGRNPDSLNIGADPSISNNTRWSDYNNALLQQGVPQNQLIVEFHAGWEFLPNLFLEGAVQYEYLEDSELGTRWWYIPSVLVRWGVPFRSLRF